MANTTSTVTVKNTKQGQYGYMVWVDDTTNAHSEEGKDWCLFQGKDCTFDLSQLSKGETITIEWNRVDRQDKPPAYYLNEVKGVAAKQEASATQSSGGAPDWDAITYEKARNIFLAGWMNNVMHGAAAAGINPNQSFEWLQAGMALWEESQKPPQKPGDAPRNESESPNPDDWSRG